MKTKMLSFYTNEEWKQMLSHRRYGTHISNLRPEDIKCIGYWRGSFYVSEYLWNDFGEVLQNATWELTWLAAPGWFYSNENKCLYQWLASRYDLFVFHEGEWMLLSD